MRAIDSPNPSSSETNRLAKQAPGGVPAGHSRSCRLAPPHRLLAAYPQLSALFLKLATKRYDRVRDKCL